MDDTYTHLFLAKPASRFLSEDAQQGMPLLIKEFTWHLYRHRLEKPGSWTIDGLHFMCCYRIPADWLLPPDALRNLSLS